VARVTCATFAGADHRAPNKGVSAEETAKRVDLTSHRNDFPRNSPALAWTWPLSSVCKHKSSSNQPSSR